MRETVEDPLFLWCLYQCPALLQDQELFNKLVLFIHQLLLSALQDERSRRNPSVN